MLSLTCWDQGRSGQGERELESTGAFSRKRQCSSNKVLHEVLQSKKHKIQVTESQVLCSGF